MLRPALPGSFRLSNPTEVNLIIMSRPTKEKRKLVYLQAMDGAEPEQRGLVLAHKELKICFSIKSLILAAGTRVRASCPDVSCKTGLFHFIET